MASRRTAGFGCPAWALLALLVPLTLSSSPLIHAPGPKCPVGTWSISSAANTCICPSEMECVKHYGATSNATNATTHSNCTSPPDGLDPNMQIRGAFPNTCRDCHCVFTAREPYNAPLVGIYNALRRAFRTVKPWRKPCHFPFLFPGVEVTHPTWGFTRRILLSQMAVQYTFLQIGGRIALSDGSLLGAVRQGGFIPWDNDGDVTIDFPAAWPQNRTIQLLWLEAAVNKTFSKFGLHDVLLATREITSGGWEWMQIRNASGSDPLLPRTSNTTNPNPFFLDVFPWPFNRTLCRCQLDGVQFFCPVDAMEQMEEAYGKSWRTPKSCKTVNKCEGEASSSRA